MGSVNIRFKILPILEISSTSVVEFSRILWLKVLHHARELEEMANVFVVTNDRWNSLVKTDRIINAVKQNTFKNKDESAV